MNKYAAVIISLAIAAWLVSGVAFSEEAPAWAGAAFGVAFAIAVPVVVFYLMSDMGWRGLARRYRVRVPFSGRWQPLPTAEVASVSVQDPDYAQHRLRLVGTVRVGVTDASLYLSMLFGRIPLLGPLFFPDVQVDWSEVRSARPYEAPGWFTRGKPGAVVANYDPNYTGPFVELEVGEPPVYLQLPASLLRDVESRLPATQAGNHVAPRA